MIEIKILVTKDDIVQKLEMSPDVTLDELAKSVWRLQKIVKELLEFEFKPFFKYSSEDGKSKDEEWPGEE